VTVMTDAYERASYGSGSIGFGTRPAVLVVDFQLAFTDPRFPLGNFARVHEAVETTARLLEVARRCGAPVASCWVSYAGAGDMPYWKVGAVREQFFHDHPGSALDPRIHDPGHDFSFPKGAPSIFFNTPLPTFLVKQGVDTVIVTGCMTSGCVRASVIDSFSYGYRTVVPEDCCGDAEEGPHRDNLRDVGRRYADVTTAAEVAVYLEENRRRNA
jgi:maleamate amidohydrolase